MTHADLVEVAGRWLKGKGRCKVIAKEIVSCTPEQPDAIGWTCWGDSFLIECKASRSDFLSDKRKVVRRHSWMGAGRNRYYMVPRGLVGAHELPEGWGLLEVVGKRVFVARKATPATEYSHVAEAVLLVSVARRCAGVYEGENVLAPVIVQ